jgi:hypothetical protein
VSTPRRNSRPPMLHGLKGPPLADHPSNQILDYSIQNHPKPVTLLASGVSSGSGLTPLNPTIDHTYIYTVDTSGVNRLASCPNICPTIFYYVRALDRCYKYTSLRARSATGIEVCNRSAHCEGINGRQPYNLCTFLLLEARTRSAHGRAALRVRFGTSE